MWKQIVVLAKVHTNISVESGTGCADNPLGDETDSGKLKILCISLSLWLILIFKNAPHLIELIYLMLTHLTNCLMHS